MWWRWSLLLLLGTTVLCQDEELVSKRVYLKTPASFVNLTSESWKLNEDTESVLVAVKFTAQAAVGRLLSTKFLREDGSIEAELVLALESGQLQVDLLDSQHKSVLIKPLVNIYMNESVEHSVAVNVNAREKSLTFTVERGAEHTAEIISDIQWAGAEIVTTLGGGLQAVVGCIALVTVQVSGQNPLSHVIVVAQNEIDKCATDQECARRNCGRGRCLALEVATCDCFGTTRTGPNCASDPKVIELDNSADDADLVPSSVHFTPWKEDQSVNRLTMEFKFKSTEEGVLMYGGLEGGGHLKMFVVGQIGTLDIAGHTPLNFSLASTKDFHQVGLFFNDAELRFSVDGVAQSTTLPAPLLLTFIVFGSSPPTDGVAELGLTACVRNIYVDHLDVLELHANKDHRVTTAKPLKPCSDGSDLSSIGQKMFPAEPELFEDNEFDDDTDEEEDADIATAGLFGGPSVSSSNIKKKEAVPCEKAQEFLCRNGASCLRGDKRPQCICAPGFGGLNCQFSILPRTCSDASRFHRIPEGPTRLDVDGSRPLSTSIADCRDGVTVIPHDMPADTAIRAAEEQKHGLFVLSYRDFTPAKLETLVLTSGDCRQQVNYKCNHAPLSFSEKRTWFRVAHGNSTISQLGTVPQGCQCIDTGCANQGKCNCDADGIGSDEGVLRGLNSAVTSIVSLHRQGDVSGQMTIGPLQCSGSSSDSLAVRFRKSQELKVSEWTGEALSIQFRTADATATLLSVENDGEDVLSLEMLDGHTLKAVTLEGDVVVESQAKLNDTRWHLLVIEWLEEELRVSIDAASAFKELKTQPSGKLTVGHNQRGLVGCVRSLFLSNRPVGLQQAAMASGLEMDECGDSCTSSTCRNGAECRENFAKATAECSCRYPRVQSGSDCSIDLNSDSSVSFHGGFLKYEALPSPLTSSWILSFRTDQSSALLLYVHDQNNNFLQVHVRDEVLVTLSLNNGPVVSTCSVQAPPGTEYGDMKWVQLYVDHGPTGSTLTVEDEACTIRTTRELSDTPLKTFTNWNSEELVSPPVGLEDVHKEFAYVFFGGVERAVRGDGGEHRLKAEYNSPLPDLLGCMRGAKVGDEVVDLRHTTHGVRPEDPSLVRTGCNVHCESLACHNGGHCSVAWKNYDPSADKTTCDCSRTSYAGPNCLQDDGIAFTSPQALNFDIGGVLERYLEPAKHAQFFKFAFSAEQSIYRQMLATVYFDDSSEFEVLVNKNGSLHVGIAYADGRSTALTLKGNFSDGYRHFFAAQFAADQATRVSVDGVQRVFASRGTDNLDLFRSKRLWLGGQRVPPTFESGIPPKKNLNGCVSNVNVNLGVHVLDMWPISYLGANHSYSSNTQLNPPGAASRGSCAAFRVPNRPAILANTVNLPVWETNFRRQEYLTDDLPGEIREEGGVPWLLIILAILLIFLPICLIVVIICLCRKGQKNTSPQNISMDEREPLRRTEFPQTPPMMEKKPHSNYAIPPPDIQLSPTSRVEDFSDPEDFERTLTPGSDAATLFEDEISRPTGFDRSSPQRMSSFRDSSAPIGSPLYSPPESQRRLRPVALPQPPPRTSSST